MRAIKPLVVVLGLTLCGCCCGRPALAPPAEPALVSEQGPVDAPGTQADPHEALAGVYLLDMQHFETVLDDLRRTRLKDVEAELLEAARELKEKHGRDPPGPPNRRRPRLRGLPLEEKIHQLRDEREYWERFSDRTRDWYRAVFRIRLSLYADGTWLRWIRTFENPVVDAHADGTWTVDGDEVVLQESLPAPFLQPEPERLRIEEGALRFRVEDEPTPTRLTKEKSDVPAPR